MRHVRACCFCVPLRAGTFILAVVICILCLTNVIWRVTHQSTWNNSFYGPWPWVQWISVGLDAVMAGGALLGMIGVAMNSFRLVGIWSSLHRFILSFALVRAIGIPILMIARRSAVVDLCLSRNPTNQSGCESAATYATAVVAAMGIFSFLLMYYFYTCIESYRRRLAAAQYGVLGDPERALDPSGNPFKQGDRSSKDSGVYRSDTPPKSYSTSQPNDSSATLTAKPDWEAMPRPSFDPAARDSMETDPFHDIELPRASEEVERLEFPQPPPPFPIEAKYQRPPSN